MSECFVCDRIQMIKEGKNPYFVRELMTGYVVLWDIQRFKGYTLFICKEHATELHFLDDEYRTTYLQEMAMVAEAVYHAFQPDKLEMNNEKYKPSMNELETLKKKLNIELEKVLI